MSDDPRKPGWGMGQFKRELDDQRQAGRMTPQEAIRRQPELPQDTARRVVQAARKGQVALLVTDAAGVVIVGIKGTGGMTKLQYREGVWSAEVHLSGVEILDGSYLLRAPLGWGDPDDGDVVSDEQAEALAKRALERHQQPALPYPEGES